MIGLIELVVLAFLLWGGFMLFTIVKKGGGWAAAGVIAAVVLVMPVMLILVAIFSWRASAVVPTPEAAFEPLAVRIEEQHADAVRVIRDARAEVERARQDVDRVRQKTAAVRDVDRDAAAVVQLHLDATALSEHHVSTADLGDAIATLCELVALAGDDHPIEVSQLRRIRLAGSDDEPLPLAAVLGDLSRSTNLLAKATGPRVIRIVTSPSADLGPANADELAAELITHDELVESTIHGTFTQEVSGHTVRLQVYQRESLTDEEQQLADAASAQIIATLLPVESAETPGTADDALLAASEAQAERSPADTVPADREESDTEEVDTEESGTEEAGTEEASAEAVASDDEQPADASDEAINDDETVDAPDAGVTDADVSAGDESDEEAVADAEAATEDEVVTDAVADVTDTAEEVESLEAAVAASRAVTPPSPATPSSATPLAAASIEPVPPVQAVPPVAPAAIDAPVELSLPVEIDTSPERPDWVNDEDELKNDGVYRATVSAGPYETRIECDRALDDAIYSATIEYLQHLQSHATYSNALDRNYLRSNLVKELWEERQETSVGPMRTIHARLEYTPEVRQRLLAISKQREVNQRLAQTGVLSGLVLAVLGTLFGYFKLDTLTKGYYSTRLKLLAGAVILGVFGVLVRLFA